MIKDRSYELLDHTADFGIRVAGKDAKELFEKAGLALFDLMVNPERVAVDNAREIAVAGSDWEDLMINWLRELLYLFVGEELVVKEIDVLSIQEDGLRARMGIGLFVSGETMCRHEIKAVTYHQIQVLAGPEKWSARIIFDA